MRLLIGKSIIALGIAFLLSGCGERSAWRGTLREVGPERFRSETLAVCRGAFVRGGIHEIPEQSWPGAARAFGPMGLWAEPDGAYVLINSDAGSERGLYLPRILSDKDPLCGPTLRHEKLAEGVYWYEKKRL